MRLRLGLRLILGLRLRLGLRLGLGQGLTLKKRLRLVLTLKLGEAIFEFFCQSKDNLLPLSSIIYEAENIQYDFFTVLQTLVLANFLHTFIMA